MQHGGGNQGLWAPCGCSGVPIGSWCTAHVPRAHHMPHTEQCPSTTAPMADTNQSIWHRLPTFPRPPGPTHPPPFTKVTNTGAQTTHPPPVDLGKNNYNETLPNCLKGLSIVGILNIVRHLHYIQRWTTYSTRRGWHLPPPMACGLVAVRAEATTCGVRSMHSEARDHLRLRYATRLNMSHV